MQNRVAFDLMQVAAGRVASIDPDKPGATPKRISLMAQ